jgi:hypothetical protein
LETLISGSLVSGMSTLGVARAASRTTPGNG